LPGLRISSVLARRKRKCPHLAAWKTSRHSDMAIVPITVIDASYIIPFVQIPIAHRRG